MKKIIHNSCASLLAVLVLLSTMSFSVNMHYCGKTLVDVSVFNVAKSCEMPQMKSTQECSVETKKKSCCTDKQIIVEGKEDLKDIVKNLTFEQQVFLVSFTHSYIYLFSAKDTAITSFIEYPPPLLDKDYQILYETFLI
ncbi:hypothetical protein M0D21_17935 [Aquimarina sp. D1M17]|uniref:HYC_CC_PP family protein n=1 Tax=Aquimarina acroporae TaxID=2937283 RepID=UPI0020BD9232|nr:hypothetical protein [Aquimarina acroporae]MCK8523468.1 hypothetical protein [Aquimarina acroporae]